jgi:two-component system, LytTR family, response regulator
LKRIEETASEPRIRALIVDDEPLARRRIRELLERCEGIEVAGEAEDGLEAAHAVAEMRPDLLFLDVQLPAMDGFDVIAALEPPLPLIIFTTAYETYALRAFEVSAVDYLLKPVEEERFHAAVARARTAFATNSQGAWSDRIRSLLTRLDRREKRLSRIVVKEEGRVLLVDTRDVEWFESAGNYVRIHLRDGAHLIRATMHSLEQSLDGRAFVRIHRSTIVNLSRVAELQPRARGTYAVILKSGAELELSAAYRGQLEAAIGSF